MLCHRTDHYRDTGARNRHNALYWVCRKVLALDAEASAKGILRAATQTTTTIKVNAPTLDSVCWDMIDVSQHHTTPYCTILYDVITLDSVCWDMVDASDDVIEYSVVSMMCTLDSVCWDMVDISPAPRIRVRSTHPGVLHEDVLLG